MLDTHHPTVLDREDLANVSVTCSCGEWQFQGDWDDMCASWFQHEADPDYKHFYVGRGDTSFLTRAGGEAFTRMMAERDAR